MSTSQSVDNDEKQMQNAQADPFAYQREYRAKRSPETKRVLALIKRFTEWLMADGGLRATLLRDPGSARRLLAERRVDFDPQTVAPMWARGFTTTIPKVEPGQYPLLDQWIEWVRDILRFRDMLRNAGDPREFNPRFNAWRRRLIRRNDFEFGPRNRAITYPLFCYELSLGCSVGCWFCGFSAPRLTAVFKRTPENTRLWRGILETAVDLAGPRAARTGICYHATEPADNPDYIEFLLDYQRVNGILCQTTTAAATRRPDWTRRLVKLYEELDGIKPRFSILSLAMLRQVQSLFTADELLYVECLMQNPESMLFKACSGRAAQDERARWENEYRDRYSEKTMIARHENPVSSHNVKLPEDCGGTMACLSGFLVNLIEKTVRLISPCESSTRWPHGYRVHFEGRFDTLRDYRALLQRAIATHMPESMPDDTPLRFRRKLTYAEASRGFALASNHLKVTFTAGAAPYQPVGRLVAEGCWTARQILDRLLDKGEPALDVMAVLQDLCDKGLLEDEFDVLCPDSGAPAAT